MVNFNENIYSVIEYKNTFMKNNAYPYNQLLIGVGMRGEPFLNTAKGIGIGLGYTIKYVAIGAWYVIKYAFIYTVGILL